MSNFQPKAVFRDKITLKWPFWRGVWSTSQNGIPGWLLRIVVKTRQNTSKTRPNTAKHVKTRQKHVKTGQNTSQTRQNASKHVKTRQKHVKTALGSQNESSYLKSRSNGPSGGVFGAPRKMAFWRGIPIGLLRRLRWLRRLRRLNEAQTAPGSQNRFS